MNKNIVIAIGRQFGSGGREIGKLVAEKLGINFYDKELINMAAKESGINEDLINTYDEKPTNSFLYSLSLGAYSFENSFGSAPQMPIVDKVFSVQAQVIKDIADRESCVIIGRCADSILRDYPNLVSVFIHSDFDSRIRRISEYENVSHDVAAELVRKADKKRASYHNYFSENKWGVATSYDLCINSKIGYENVADLIISCVKNA